MILAAVLAMVAWAALRDRGQPVMTLPIPGEGDQPVVEVLNTTTADGLAREVTRRLRRAGIDVVYFGSDRGRGVDTTTILVRRGDSTQAARVREVLGMGRIVMAPDPRLLLDASVLLGPDLARALNLNP